MPTKRDREYARRRYAKQQERAARAARLRRERAIVAVVTVIGLVGITVAAVLLNRGADDIAELPTEVSPTASQELGGQSSPLPTTNPEQYQAPPPPTDSLGQDWDVTITTNVGDIDMTLDGEAAPQAVANFLFLAQNGFYDGTACHRLLPDSLLQCGDPSATGTGGPGYAFGPIENAPEDDMYPQGTVAMARQGNDGESMGSQFFLVFANVPLPSDQAGGYSVFGQITSGLDILQQIASAGLGADQVRPATDVIIESVEIA